jgi:hypothetical protein
MKKGRISKQEEQYIQDNLSLMSHVDIAEKLDRDPYSIQQFIKRKFKIGLSGEEEAAYQLEDRPYWTNIKEQFTEAELELFRYHWSRIISQFKDDVIPTEEVQVVDLIKLDLLMNRSLSSSKDNLEQVRALEVLIAEERNRAEDQDRDQLFNMERQAASLKASTEALGRDYRDLQDKKNKMLKEMKATREQRVKRLEDSNQSFTGWLSFLISNPETMMDYGLEMEKMRLAMEKEKVRLGSFHKYDDGDVDRPFLNHETVFYGEDADGENTDT